MTRHVEVQIRQVPDTDDLSHWRHVVAVTSNGAYWPIAVARSEGRAEIARRALQAYADANPEGLVDEIYSAESGEAS